MISAEDKLLFLCCRSRFSPSDTDSLLTLVRTIDDWEGFLKRVNYHRLQPRFYSLMKTSGGASQLAPSLWEKIEACYRKAQFSVLALEAELVTRLLPAFNQSEIDVLLLKGAALNQTVYQNRPIRFFVDLDLLIHGHDLKGTRTLLEKLGYLPTLSHFPSEWHQKQTSIQAHEVSFPYIHSEKGINVDLHVDAFEEWLPFNLPSDWLWQNVTVVHFSDAHAFLPDPTQLFTHLFLHLIKHARAGEDALGWYLDLDELLRYFGSRIDLRNVPLQKELAKTLGFLKTNFDPKKRPDWKISKQIQSGNRQELFLLYWKGLTGLRSKLWFALRWLFPDASYLRKKYRFRNLFEKTWAYARHLFSMSCKGIGLALYGFKAKIRGSNVKKPRSDFEKIDGKKARRGVGFSQSRQR